MLTSIYGYARFRQRALVKWSLKLTEVDQTWLNLSWSGCAQTDMAILKYSTTGPSLFSDLNEKMGFVRAKVHLESSNLVSTRHSFSRKSKQHGLFCSSAIYKGSLFTDRNEIMGFVRARVHLESSNLVCRHSFSRKSKWHGLFCSSPICCDRNKKLVTDRVRLHLQSLAWSAQ